MLLICYQSISIIYLILKVLPHQYWICSMHTHTCMHTVHNEILCPLFPYFKKGQKPFHTSIFYVTRYILLSVKVDITNLPWTTQLRDRSNLKYGEWIKEIHRCTEWATHADRGTPTSAGKFSMFVLYIWMRRWVCCIQLMKAKDIANYRRRLL